MIGLMGLLGSEMRSETLHYTAITSNIICRRLGPLPHWAGPFAMKSRCGRGHHRASRRCRLRMVLVAGTQFLHVSCSCAQETTDDVLKQVKVSGLKLNYGRIDSTLAITEGAAIEMHVELAAEAH
jgi:hypothetical protein